ncbi:MAG TPA: lamin tail domain-containing protein [Pyrinomonadaceae bacterium]|nr:lamin tail domain-containing protein [Pyrinomonadaceae bacterium]
MISIPLRSRRPIFARRQLFALALVVSLLAILLPTRFNSVIPAAQAVSTTFVISQFQTGGGVATDEFVELHNVSGVAQDLNGHRLVYRTSTGTTDATTPLAVWTTTTMVPAGGYYLVAASPGYDGAPAADRTYNSGSVSMSGAAAGAGIALRNGAANTGTIVDSVAYGTTSTTGFTETTNTSVPANNDSRARKSAGCQDTDNNANDFEGLTPSAPRNSMTTPAVCGAATPTLSINDVTQDEGNGGTTTFTFTVSVSPVSPSAVTFNIATADGTAQDGVPAGEDTDYVAKSETGRTIAANTASTTFTVTVNGDTNVEPNETFFVNVTNVSGVTAGDTQGLGTIRNDDFSITPIFNIQGSGMSSPFNGQQVTTNGIVTGRKTNGYFLQSASDDGNPNTSNAIFVFTSSAPTGVAIGDAVTVTGTVSEFEAADSDEPDGVTPVPDPKTATELVGPFTLIINSSGNPLPAAIDVSGNNNIFNPNALSRGAELEKYEFMRVSVPSMTVSEPTNNFGEFWGVVTGVPRPFREPGIERGDPIPVADQGPYASATPPNVPIWDGNFERIQVDSDDATTPAGARRAQVQVTTGTVVTGVTGPLDFAFLNYRIVLDYNVTPGTSGGITAAIPVPTPATGEFTIASANLENFGASNADFAGRLNKASLAIRNVMRTPDILGVIEVFDKPSLDQLAAKINADAGNSAAVNYVAYLEEGIIPGDASTNFADDQDIGFLVNTARVDVIGMPVQAYRGNNFTYAGTTSTLHDRPPFILTADVPQAGTATKLRVTVIHNHTKSLIAVDSPVPRGTGGTEGGRNREKRRLQAEDIANLVQARQNENLVVTGDLNAFDFNDGFGDIVGTIKGTPVPPEQVVEPSTDIWTYQLYNSLRLLPADQQYSLLFEGNAQALDHVLVNNKMRARQTRFAYGRYNADFSESFAADTNRPERLSDHDAAVSYFATGAVTLPGAVLISEFRFNGPNGLNDEFIELYNNSELPVDISGWTLGSATGGNVVIDEGSTIPARGHYLVASDGFSLENGVVAAFTAPATPDQTYAGAAFPDNGGVKLTDAVGDTIDAVGFSGTAAGFNEGTGLSPAGGVAPASDEQISFVRRLTSGFPQDTNNNAADFVLVSTTGTVGGTPNLLGAPGPESTESPIQRNGTVKASLIDNCFDIGTPTSGCQNRVRDGAANNPTNAARGTLTFRRKFKNTNQQSVTALRFRVVDITTLNSPGYAPNNGQADLRLLSSASATVTPSNPFVPGDIQALGTTLDEPPAQPLGGGLNSSVTVNLSQPLLFGDSVTVQLTVGVQQNGSYRFFVNTEAVLGAATATLETKAPRGGKANRR